MAAGLAAAMNCPLSVYAIIGVDSLIRRDADRINAIANGHISINRKILSVLLVFPAPASRPLPAASSSSCSCSSPHISWASWPSGASFAWFSFGRSTSAASVAARHEPWLAACRGRGTVQQIRCCACGCDPAPPPCQLCAPDCSSHAAHIQRTTARL